MDTLKSCPICNSGDFLPFLSCKDYTVSRETFSIVRCVSCGFRFTNPRPEAHKLGGYYLSEDYISHSNSSKGLINWLYKKVRAHTIKGKVAQINEESPVGQILDIGCGTGEFLNACISSGWKGNGVEPSEMAAAQAKKNFGLSVFSEEEMNKLPSTSYDIITMWHVLEHVPSLIDRIKDLHRLLKSNGVVLIAVPNCESKDAKHYKEFWAAYDVPRHLYHFSPGDIENLFSKHGFTIKSILPMKFDSYYVSMLSEKYKSGKPRILRALFQGALSNLNVGAKGLTSSSQIYILKKA